MVLVCLTATAVVSGGDSIRFSQQIRPILSKKCFTCHGPDAKQRKAHLRLDRSDGEEGAYRVRDGSQAIQGGSLDGSALWYRINTNDPDDIMPPADVAQEAVTTEEKRLIRDWILAGAEYEEFWAFVPPRRRELPQPDATVWNGSHPIDRFVLAQLKRDGLEPSTQTSRRTLIRRVTFDLTGLPPTLEEIARFLNDSSESAYEDLVDRLLAKPQYGEHMAKYWLDLVRFADTNGLHHDHYREMTPYRDWVIRAFNDDLPFDNFIKYQVAGDLFAEPSLDQQIASGFNRLHLIIDRGTALPQESFTRNVVDRVAAVGTAFLGLTVQCAVCHDHKYDPIRQKDFYQLFAFFNNFDGGPETGGRSTSDFKRGLQPPYIDFPSPEQTVQLERIDAEISRLNTQLETLPADPEPSAERKALSDQLARQRQARAAVEEAIPATLVMKERAEVRPAHILIRGVYDQPGEEVGRDTPAFLPPMQKRDGLKTRLDFADWLVAKSNPLTARVTVNRFWQQFFGVGLVRTSEDFGAQGERPSHPELLDDLAVRFLQSGWDVKELVRSIVSSKTYQQTSRAPPEKYLADPDNRRLARGPRFRLDAEMIRDQVLAVSGLLSPTMFGRSVKPPQPSGLWKMVAMPSSYPRAYEADTQDRIYRRSVYTFWKRALPPPQMSIFDAPTRESCIARRERTNTPLQALVLMNEEQYFLAASYCARELLRSAEREDDERIRLAFEKVTSQLPGAAEMESLQDALHDFRKLYASDAASAAAITTDLLHVGADPAERIELAAWTMLVHSLLNLDVTKTRQ
jgi:hypothetical protein